MGALSDFRSRWFVTTLCVVTAVFFMAALLVSAAAYVRIIDARESIVLADAHELAEELPNGTLRLSIDIDLRNPSKFDLSISTVSWSVGIDISGMGGASFLPLASAYKGATESLVLAAGETRTLGYTAVVGDPALLSQIDAFISASDASGDEYTLETIPYEHDFRITAWIGDFRHDYQYYGEIYLNDMVKIERSYSDGVFT